MKHRLFIRNLRAAELFERFIVSAISSLLLLRFYLYLAGYPQVGGGNLHIAHMLWGGALMLLAFVLNFAFLGFRIQKLVAILGGVGFGIFIDEIGKFLTKDNNYFFRPAIGIIYAIFVGLYLTSSFLSRRQQLSSREYQLNALGQLEEAIVNDLDPYEKIQALALLKHAEKDSIITIELQKLLNKVALVKQDKPNYFERLIHWIHEVYRRAWLRRGSDVGVRVFFAAEAAAFMIAVAAALYTNIDDVQDFFRGTASYGQSLVIGQLVATIIATVFAVIGISRLRDSRRDAFEYFRRAALTNLLLTEFFVFSRIQFGAMPSFIFNLALLIIINFSISEERRQIQLKTKV